MTLWDVNLWVYAFRADSPLHDLARAELEGGSRSGDAYPFCPWVAASFQRLVTDPRIFVRPSRIDEAWTFADALESSARGQDRRRSHDLRDLQARVSRHQGGQE